MKKSNNGKPDRSNPKTNKSLAIRNALKKMPTAKAAEIAAAVRKEYGHDVSPNMIYMVKTKTNMRADGRQKPTRSVGRDTPLTTPAVWIDAIKSARQLLKLTGSVPNAVALIKAIDN